MSLLRFLWIALCVWWATVSYGELALEIAVCGHLGITAINRLLFRFSKGLALIFTFGAAGFLMYETVHLIGWGCFGILLLSFTTLTVEK